MNAVPRGLPADAPEGHGVPMLQTDLSVWERRLETPGTHRQTCRDPTFPMAFASPAGHDPWKSSRRFTARHEGPFPNSTGNPQFVPHSLTKSI